METDWLKNGLLHENFGAAARFHSEGQGGNDLNRTIGYTSAAKYKALEDLQRDSSELCLCYCGWEQCEPGHRYGPNRRKNYVLHFVSEGSGTLEVNGNQYNINKGEIL